MRSEILDKVDEKMVLETFCEWFQGHWNNRTQAFSNPKGQAYVVAVHTRTFIDQFRCIYTRHREHSPYRDVRLDVKYENNKINMRSVGGPHSPELVFQLKNGIFVCDTHNDIGDKHYRIQGFLSKDHYYVNDQCFQNGKLVRGLEDGHLYEFEKIHCL